MAFPRMDTPLTSSARGWIRSGFGVHRCPTPSARLLGYFSVAAVASSLWLTTSKSAVLLFVSAVDTADRFLLADRTVRRVYFLLHFFVFEQHLRLYFLYEALSDISYCPVVCVHFLVKFAYRKSGQIRWMYPAHIGSDGTIMGRYASGKCKFTSCDYYSCPFEDIRCCNLPEWRLHCPSVVRVR